MHSLGQMMRVLALTQTILLILGLSRAEAAVVASNEISLKRTVYEMDIDELIDDNMQTIRQTVWEMDPFKLDDINFPLTKHIYMFLHTGWAQNLADLERSGKCSIRYADKKLNVDMNLGWGDLVFDYRYLIRMLTYKREGDLHGQMTKLNVHIGLEIDFRNYHITLKKLSLEEKGKINIKLEGHLLDPVYNLAIKTVTNVFRTVTLKTITDKLRGMITHRIDEINFKLGAIINGEQQFTFVDLTRPTSFNDDTSPILYNNDDDNQI